MAETPGPSNPPVHVHNYYFMQPPYNPYAMPPGFQDGMQPPYMFPPQFMQLPPMHPFFPPNMYHMHMGNTPQHVYQQNMTAPPAGVSPLVSADATPSSQPVSQPKRRRKDRIISENTLDEVCSCHIAWCIIIIDMI